MMESRLFQSSRSYGALESTTSQQNDQQGNDIFLIVRGPIYSFSTFIVLVFYMFYRFLKTILHYFCVLFAVETVRPDVRFTIGGSLKPNFTYTIGDVLNLTLSFFIIFLFVLSILYKRR